MKKLDFHHRALVLGYENRQGGLVRLATVSTAKEPQGSRINILYREIVDRLTSTLLVVFKIQCAKI